jgi:signal transduction histidine kinase
MKAHVMSVVLERPDARRLVLDMDHPAAIDATYDLRGAGWPKLVMDALAVFFQSPDRMIRVVAEPGMATDQTIEVVMGEGPLKEAMLRYSLDVLALSVLISVITGTLVYLALAALLVRPMMRLTGNIVRFREQPEDPSRIIKPSDRTDEIGQAERALASMQHDLAQTLSQKRRLAALGLGVSKVSHDLRNMLGSAQLLSDRLAAVKDPTVQRLVPKLLASLERAIRLCASTLDFSQTREPEPQRTRFAVNALVAEIAEALSLPRLDIAWSTEIEPGLEIDADRDQLFRVLTNLTRNAVQALEAEGKTDGSIALRAWHENEATLIEIADNGPGVPRQATPRLFEAFQSVARKGGTGLGLAIAAELVQAHGGRIALVNNEAGATFRVTLPDQEPRPAGPRKEGRARGEAAGQLSP